MNMLTASTFRSVGNMIIKTYLPVYFARIFPQYSTQYSLLSGINLLIFGLTSNLLSGQISQRYEKKYPRTNALICVAGTVLCLPFIFACCFSNSFWLSLIMMGLAIFLSGSYFAPAISMMQNSVSPQNSGYVVASYGLVSTLA